MKEMKVNGEESGNQVPQEIRVPLEEETGEAENAMNENSDPEKSNYEEEPDEEEYKARRAARMKRLKKRRRRRRIKRIIAVGVLVLAVAAVVAGVVYFKGGFKGGNTQAQAQTGADGIDAGLADAGTAKNEGTPDENGENGSGQEGNNGSPDGADTVGKESKDTETGEESGIVGQAGLLAAQYHYDKAIELLKSDSAYNGSEQMQQAVKEYEEAKASCVSWPLEEVTHVFYHSLIKDTAKAFDGDYKQGDYNQVMTTIDEFNKITQIMYDKGYVMVSIRDIASVDDNGSMIPGEILLPPGKIPFVLSQDDLSYYHYMEGDGFPQRLIVDEEGKVRNEYLEDDGSVSVGDYDVVPLIDRFVEEHPDFSYRGAKGIVALTGYNGILGYRSDISYETRPDDLDANKVAWLDAHPDFSLEQEREGARKVANAMKEGGWLFASHTWGHQNIADVTLDRLMADTQRFKDNVDPIIGGTDIIIFAFGTDINHEEDYHGEKYEFLKEQGYHYFCNVDSRKYFVQLRDSYLRMGRRNLDGYRMYYNPELLEDLFDTKAVFDPVRPVPVPQMG